MLKQLKSSVCIELSCLDAPSSLLMSANPITIGTTSCTCITICSFVVSVNGMHLSSVHLQKNFFGRFFFKPFKPQQ